jgi:hypothetical protein
MTEMKCSLGQPDPKEKPPNMEKFSEKSVKMPNLAEILKYGIIRY